MPYNSRADVVRLLAERYDTQSNVKLGELWIQLNNLSVDNYIYIYIYIYISNIQSASETESIMIFFTEINL